MSVHPLGNMHPMGASYDDNDQSYDDANQPSRPPVIARPCPSLPPINEPNSRDRISLEPLKPWDHFYELTGAQKIFDAIDKVENLVKYDDKEFFPPNKYGLNYPTPVGVIMGTGNSAMTIRLSQIPEAVAKGWALLGLFDETAGDKIVIAISKAFSPQGSEGFPTIHYQFTKLAFPRLIKLHYMGQMLGLSYAKFLDKIARQISFYSGRNGFNKFFGHYFEKVKDAYRYPLAYRTKQPPPLP